MKVFCPLAVSAFLASFYIAPAVADEVKFSLGGGFYESKQEFDYYADDEFNGFALTGTAAFNNYIGARLNMYWAEHDDYSTWEASGYDALVLGGYNLIANGFKAYVSAGFFREEWEEYGFTKTFSGPQFGIGVGYNLDKVAFDFSLNFRDSRDYDDYWVPDTSSVTSSMLSASYRF